ncbi:metal ABC transporter ATP-binding protein [Dictyoglomus thermophilum]|uniref:High-affinity zinc uptake system ATP-binding protein ZnuC n=2 Tax=Dictyoglomus thermophilum TaxID=14 RepID=B5YAB9_DICT6|nr:metal ABC transporter ATP-binding protein [Dictyoglomus thermophilum]ACI18600.1 high-affinity zinc uptake system ATP-binding protein ZnuC [Dictyoglomus thermophilum H-6-12]MCX7720441.1 metal ABC transporter ATP-binding protein [Dictyoglomus thermophilum]TYT24422.1 metal ABC transporter ATP-binding protein [Dictyoglomus thermophilum]
MNKIVEIKNLYHRYDQDLILENVNMEVLEGEFLAIIGPNGAGKSTLLKIIVGIIKPLKGIVKVFNKDVQSLKEERKWIGYVPQKPDLEKYLPLKVKDIVALGRRVVNNWQKLTYYDFEIMDKVMEDMEIKSIEDKIYGELSGGQQQRVLIARALAQEPKLLILDEPTVGIDVKTQNKFYTLLRDLKKQNKSIILVSHDIGIISKEVDRLACINRKLYLHGCPEEIQIHGALKELYGENFLLLTHKEE